MQNLNILVPSVQLLLSNRLVAVNLHEKSDNKIGDQENHYTIPKQEEQQWPFAAQTAHVHTSRDIPIVNNHDLEQSDKAHAEVIKIHQEVKIITWTLFGGDFAAENSHTDLSKQKEQNVHAHAQVLESL